MNLSKLIDSLSAIETRHLGQYVEVEVRDEHGFPLTDFAVQTEIVFGAKRVTVRFVPAESKEQPQ